MFQSFGAVNVFVTHCKAFSGGPDVEHNTLCGAVGHVL